MSWTSSAVLATTLLSIAQSAVAARFLEREDFGLFALVLVVVGFSQTLANLGTANALLHRQQADGPELDAVFWFSVGMGVVIAAGVFAAAPLCARLWGEPALAGLLHLAACIFLLDGPSQVSGVLLRRVLRFRRLAALDLASAATGAACVVAGVVRGSGAEALVVGALAAAAVRLTLTLFFARDLFVPRLRFRRADLAPFLEFGAYQTGERLVNFASWNLDKVLIGLWLGAQWLGVYHLAYQLAIRPFGLIAAVTSRVSAPLIAKLHADPVQMIGGYLASVRAVAMIAFPLYVGAFLVADVLVDVVYGTRWEPVAGIFRILCPLGIVYSIGNPVGALVIATGKARVGFLWNVYTAVVQTAAIAIGLRFGLEGLALSITLATVVVIFPSGFYLRWVLARVQPTAFLACLVHPLLYAALMGAAVQGLALALGGVTAPVRLFLLVATGVLVYAAPLLTRERPLLLGTRS